ncbi:alternate-type signal peptide domain-containing protein [Microbacterium sp. STN6]|uniref:alternate-type signal peptide domain-containing protein n=1 Tax=Microbacterium sp. STN6 TaxID=2995588 RepID=UPI002260E101|nr:alternate-type signal peptide domain-containing protein [Microbacterium sp. STN6]MCX7522879.1 alternate-type signal peptide domain-containing protein [Microbacterium sp. STN6]
MNRLTKGIIAGAAGIILLGGGATFALWNDSATAGDGTITSGTLSLAPKAGGGWSDISTGTPVAIADLTNYLVVPGDVLQFTKDYTINATGDNLEATLSVVDPVTSSTDPDLKTALQVTSAFTGAASGDTITDADNAKTVTATVTVTFPEGSVTNTVAQAQSIDLSGTTVTLQQKSRTP